MFNRYAIASQRETIEKLFLAKFDYDFEPNFNGAPGNTYPIICQNSPNIIQGYEWGYLPTKEPNKLKRIIRASGDRIHLTNPFMKAVRERRCIVPANCFYGWGKDRPYLFHTNDQRLFAFAGIYNVWKEFQTGNLIKTFTIISTASNRLIERVGVKEMPVILSDRSHRTWLSNSTSLSVITKLASVSYDEKQMNGFPVSNEILKDSNNVRELMNPIGPKLKIPIEPKYEEKRKKEKGGNVHWGLQVKEARERQERDEEEERKKRGDL